MRGRTPRIVWVVGGLLLFQACDCSQSDARSAPEVAPSAPPQATPPDWPRTPSGPVRSVIVGGGAFPESTEVSLEQDALLAGEVLPAPQVMLFAGGSRARAVRIRAAPTPPPLRSRLGEIFAPRIGRTSRYRAPSMAALPASAERVRDTLSAALTGATDPQSPLLLYVAAHGEQGAQPVDNWVSLWGGDMLTVGQLADLHDARPGPLRVVIASCYSGGFAELAFARGDASAGPAMAERCGLFAGTWDRQTAGCDPDPDRRNQQGYSLHFLAALRGQDRTGKPLPAATLDLDGDGGISLLEAHTRARTQSRSIDVPTTTSERFLRQVQTTLGPPATSLLPEDVHVVERLGVALGLGDLGEARQASDALVAELDALDARVVAAEQALDGAYRALAAVLLARWPVLDDPYHPAFAATLEGQHEAIAAVLDRAPEARAFEHAQADLDRADAAYWSVRAREALVARYVRAQETLALAGALVARGGPDAAAYRRLLSCERYVPRPSQR